VANGKILDYISPSPKRYKFKRPYRPSVTFIVLLLLILLFALSIFLPMFSTARYFPVP